MMFITEGHIGTAEEPNPYSADGTEFTNWHEKIVSRSTGSADDPEPCPYDDDVPSNYNAVVKAVLEISRR